MTSSPSMAGLVPATVPAFLRAMASKAFNAPKVLRQVTTTTRQVATLVLSQPILVVAL